MYEFATYNNHNAFSSAVLVRRVVSKKKILIYTVGFPYEFLLFFLFFFIFWCSGRIFNQYSFPNVFFFCNERSENSVQLVQRARAGEENSRRRNVISSWGGFAFENRGLVSDRAVDLRRGYCRPPQQPDPPGR